MNKTLKAYLWAMFKALLAVVVACLLNKWMFDGTELSLAIILSSMALFEACLVESKQEIDKGEL